MGQRHYNEPTREVLVSKVILTPLASHLHEIAAIQTEFICIKTYV